MNVFRFETHSDTILDVSTNFACSTWMCCERGEGEEEIENQGWSRVKVSSQGTDLKGQWSLRMRANEANQIKAVKQEIVQQEVQDVRLELLLTSPFSFPQNLVSEIHHD